MLVGFDTHVVYRPTIFLVVMNIDVLYRGVIMFIYGFTYFLFLVFFAERYVKPNMYD